MKRVGIRELKANLSRYLREVEAGSPLLVTDRGRVLAFISPVGGRRTAGDGEEIRLWRQIEAGRIVPPANPVERSWVGWRGAGLPASEIEALIEEIRGD